MVSLSSYVTELQKAQDKCPNDSLVCPSSAATSWRGGAARRRRRRAARRHRRRAARRRSRSTSRNMKHISEKATPSVMPAKVGEHVTQMFDRNVTRTSEGCHKTCSECVKVNNYGCGSQPGFWPFQCGIGPEALESRPASKCTKCKVGYTHVASTIVGPDFSTPVGWCVPDLASGMRVSHSPRSAEYSQPACPQCPFPTIINKYGITTDDRIIPGPDARTKRWIIAQAYTQKTVWCRPKLSNSNASSMLCKQRSETRLNKLCMVIGHGHKKTKSWLIRGLTTPQKACNGGHKLTTNKLGYIRFSGAEVCCYTPSRTNGELPKEPTWLQYMTIAGWATGNAVSS